MIGFIKHGWDCHIKPVGITSLRVCGTYIVLDLDPVQGTQGLLLSTEKKKDS